jgi:hypothetical protein
MSYYFSLAEEALERFLELDTEAKRLPNPGSFRRQVMAMLVNADGETDLQKQERIDAEREALELEATGYLRRVAEYADQLMDELESRGMNRRKMRQRFIDLVQTRPRAALATLKEAADLMAAAEEARERVEALRNGIRESVQEVADDHDLDSQTEIQTWSR